MNKKDNQVVEVDVLALLRTLWRRKFLILLTSLMTALLAMGYSLFVAKPMYDSTTRIYVVNRPQGENSNITNQDLQAGSYLVKDYKEIILSQDVLSKTVDSLKLHGTAAELAKKITVSVPKDTRIVSITAKDVDPVEAACIANGLRATAAEKIIEITKVSDVTTLEEAEVPIQPSSPRIKRNVVLGLVGGAVLISIIILAVEILDDRIRRPEDIEEVMGVTLLGVIPNIDKLK